MPGQLIEELSTGTKVGTFIMKFTATNQCICNQMSGSTLTRSTIVLSPQCSDNASSNLYCSWIYNSRAQYQVRSL